MAEINRGRRAFIYAYVDLLQNERHCVEFAVGLFAESISTRGLRHNYIRGGSGELILRHSFKMSVRIANSVHVAGCEISM